MRRLKRGKNDETFCILLISKDGRLAVRIDEEIKTSKFMMETKNLFDFLLTLLFLLLDVHYRKIGTYAMSFCWRTQERLAKRTLTYYSKIKKFYSLE